MIMAELIKTGKYLTSTNRINKPRKNVRQMSLKRMSRFHSLALI